MTEEYEKLSLKGLASSSVMNRYMEEPESQENMETQKIPKGHSIHAPHTATFHYTSYPQDSE